METLLIRNVCISVVEQSGTLLEKPEAACNVLEHRLSPSTKFFLMGIGGVSQRREYVDDRMVQRISRNYYEITIFFDQF